MEKLPFSDGYFDAIATEPPFDETLTETIMKGLKEINRVLKNDGRVSMMVATNQAEQIRNEANNLRLDCFVDSALDRKGTPVQVFAWKKKTYAE